MSKRIVVVVNKWWELDPVLFCLSSRYLPFGVPWPTLVDHPRPRRNPQQPGSPAAPSPRARVSVNTVDIEFWCVSDLMDHLPDKSKYQSSSERKAEHLPIMFAQQPDLCVAVGTAAGGSEYRSINGSVVVGTKCFMHNAKPNGANPDSNWDVGPFGVVIDSDVTPAEFAPFLSMESPIARTVSSAFIRPPNNSATPPAVLADYDAVALNTINVTDYRDYDAADAETIKAFRAVSQKGTMGSLETTHGLIRVFGASRFLFISGIVNRPLRFPEDVDTAVYAQNTTAAHNAGVVTAYALKVLAGMA